jgi:ABC-type branched-subunit amino acid transport system ATPase component
MTTARTSKPPSDAALRIQGLTVVFGGLIAVDAVDLDAPEGRITGLIGPNGAGKTTIFNACNGLLVPMAGRILLDDDDITRLPTSARARRGLGRTFQRMELFTSLTVRENVELGREAALAGSRVLRQVLARRAERERVREAAAEVLETCGIEHLHDVVVADLSTGQRRLVELARVLAGDFRMFLLDEPSSGLDQSETQMFGQVLQRVARARRTGMLLVEHDVSLVMEICEFIYVLDFGKLIFSGTPAEVAASRVVRDAYLGDEVA